MKSAAAILNLLIMILTTIELHSQLLM